MKRLLVTMPLCLTLSLSCAANAISDGAGHFPQGTAFWINWCPANWQADSNSAILAKELMQDTKQENLPEKLHDWICDNIYYDADAQALGTYGALSPSDVLLERRGVCEAIANLTQSLFLSANIPCVKVWGVAISEDDNWDMTEVDQNQINHTWNEYYIDGHWIPLDCTMDMGNVYANGVYLSAPHRSDYLHPDEAFFAQTHTILSRDEVLPENIPDEWAIPELRQAAADEAIPVTLLENYRQPVTKEEFRCLTNCLISGDGTLTRIETAMALADGISEVQQCSLPYQDITHCSEAESAALRALYHAGIMIGDNGYFHPEKTITRQEALLIAVRIRRWRDAACI